MDSGNDLSLFFEEGGDAAQGGQGAEDAKTKMKRRNSGSIFGLKRRTSGTKFVNLLASAKKPSRVLVTTRFPRLRPEAAPVVSVDALQETEALELLMTESGQPSNHVMRTSEEARAIVRACDGNHALTVRSAGRWLRMECASDGVIKAVEEVARCVEDASQQPGAQSTRAGLFQILGLALTCAAPENKPRYIKRCFATLVVLFCRKGCGSRVIAGDGDGQGTCIPLDAAKSLWRKLVTHDDHGDRMEGWEDERPEVMAAKTMRIAEVLASLGLINIEYEENTDGSINRWLKINHELHKEYGEFLISDPTGGLGEMPEQFERYWNEAFVRGYYEVMGDTHWKDMPANGNLMYGLEKIVSHMLRAGMLEDARTLLCNQEFVLERMLVLGPEAGTRQHVQDCRDFCDRARDDPSVGSDEFYTRDTVFLAYERVSACLSEKIVAGRGKSSRVGDEEASAEVGRAFQELGLSYSEQESDDCVRTAISYYEKAAECVRAASGPNEFVAATMFNIASIELQRKKFDKAKDRLLETLSIRSNYLADEDVRIVQTLRKLGDVLSEMDQKGEATKLYQEAVDLAKSDLQNNRLLVSNILHNKGLLHHEIGELAEAIDALEESLQWRTMELGNDDQVLALTHYSIGNVLVAQGKQKEAIPCFEESIRLKKLRPQESPMVMANLLSEEGMLWNMKGNKAKALRCLEEVVHICEGLGLERDLRVAQIRHEIGELHYAQEEYRNAAESFQFTLQVKRENLGEDDLEVHQAQYRYGCALGQFDSSRALDCLSDALAGLQTKLGEIHEEVALCIHEIAKIHERERNFIQAARWLKKEVEVLGAVFGKDHESLSIAHFDLGLAEEFLGNFSKAIYHFDEVHRIKGLTCERNHLDMAEIEFKLAVMNEKLSNYDTAMSQLEDTLRIRVHNLGYNNSIVAETINLIGKIHLSRGNYESALQSFNEVLGLEFEFNDSDRVGVADTVFGKGCVYYCKGELDEAMKSFEESLYWMKMVLGEDDPALAPIHHKMGNIHADKENTAEAIHCFDESIRLRKKKQGMTTEDEADIQSLKGVLYRIKEDDNNALMCFQRALSSLKAIFGRESDKVANLEHNIACIYVAKGEDENAMKMFEECLLVRRKILGSAHMDVASTLYSLAFVYIRLQNDYRNALKCLEESAHIRQKHLGKCDKVAMTLEKCGNTCKALGDHDGALNYYEETLAMKRILHGDDHESVASTLHEMGDLMDEIGEFEQAMKCFDEALDIRQRNLGEEHADVAATLYAKGFTFDQEGEFESALACFEESLKIRQKHYGKEHYTVGDTLDIMGCVYAKSGDSEKALCHLWDALSSRKMTQDHLKVAATLQNIGNVHKKRQEFDQAIECYDECLRVRTVKLGADHDTVGDAWIALGNMHTESDHIADATDCYEEAVRIKRLNYGGKHDGKVAPALYLFGMMLIKSREWERGRQQLDDFIRIRQSVGKVYDEEYASALAFIGDAYSAMGEKSKAVLNWTEALRLYKAFGLTEEHPNVIRVMKNLETGTLGPNKPNTAKTWMERFSAGLGDENVGGTVQDNKVVESISEDGNGDQMRGSQRPNWMKPFFNALSEEVRR